MSCIAIGFAFTFGPYYKVLYNDGGSMEPTIDDGGWIVAERMRSLGSTWVPNKYDIVAVRHGDGDLLIKRVIGLPGDVVEIEDGYIFINNKKEVDGMNGSGRICFYLVDPDTDIAWETVYQSSMPQPVPDDFVWVIGDDRDESHYGLHPISRIEGKVILW